MSRHVHRLSEINEDERTAVCAKCGPVSITSAGQYKGRRQWKCKIKKRESDRGDRRTEWYRQYQKDYYARTGGASQHKAWIKQYGLTPEDYQRLLDAQRGVCAICHEPCPTGQRLSVDHCHETGLVRGLLCRNCNRGIGLLKESVDVLRSAMDYLQR